MAIGMAKQMATGMAWMVDSLMHSWAEAAAGEFSSALAELSASADAVLPAESGN
jgi:hypothetical protein